MESISNMNTINCDPMMHVWNRYKEMKSKYRIYADMNMYENMGWNVLLSMFKYDDKIFRPDLFDKILHDTGVVALIETSISKYTPVFCYIAGGDRYPDGFFKDCKCFDLTGKQYSFSDWRNNDKIQVFFNNLTYSPDTFIDKYSYMLSELDTSIMCNVLFSRLKPIPIAKDGSAKARIDTIFNDLTQGTIKTIVQELDLTDIVDNNRPSIEVLNLTDVESSKYIQYLQHLHDNLISRLFFMMGLSINDNGKQAQISIEELNKNKNAAISLLNGWYNMRKAGFDEWESKTGEKLEFDFSDVWKSEIEVNVFNPEDAAEIDEQETEQELHGDGDSDIVDYNEEQSETDDSSIVDYNEEQTDNTDEQSDDSSIVDYNEEQSPDVTVNVEINVNAEEVGEISETTDDTNESEDKEDENGESS